MFRKLPAEHRENQPPASAASLGLHALAVLFVGALIFPELVSFARPARRQRFDLDVRSTFDPGVPQKIRVMLDVTVHDFPCIDLSLDYQDVMGTRAVDVRSTIFKQRLHPNGSAVGEVLQNDPKPVVNGGPSNPSISKNQTGNATCGDCYGALPPGECCNSCSDVLYAYRLKRWALPRIESIAQCKHDGTAKSEYQPPQIMRLDDYNSEDYLAKLSRLGSLTSSASSEARITTPFKLNMTHSGDKIVPLFLNYFSQGSGLGGIRDDDLADDDDSDTWPNGTKKVRKPWPDCVRRNVVVHGYDVGEALMADLTPHGATSGCWNDDCTSTDKFQCKSMDKCAEVCQKIAGCHWWTHGYEDLVQKCWIRSGKHGRERRYSFSSGPKSCHPDAGAAADKDAAASSGPVVDQKPSADGSAPARRLASVEDLDYGLKPYSLSWGPSLHMPVFGLDTKESLARKEQRGESCRMYGYFDTNKVPGNFHIGAHGASLPSYFNYYDDPMPQSQSMQHTINKLAFVDLETGTVLNDTQPLDGFNSPKAFTFQYYLTVTPATVQETKGPERQGYQFRAGSFVTNELIGPAVFFRLDLDPIRVTYYTEEVRWSRLLVNLCAVVGGCIAIFTKVGQIAEAAGAHTE